MTFIDNYSRCTIVYLLRNKNEVENQLNKKNQKAQDLIEMENMIPLCLIELCEKEGIIHKITPSYSSESNSIAERKNRTLKKIMNSLLISSSAPNNLWEEPILSTCHIQNRIPYKKKRGKTPYGL